MGQRMDGAEPLLEGDRAHRRRHQHVSPRGEVAAVGDRRRQPVLDQAHALDGDALGHRVEAGGAVGLQAMGERVHAGGGGDVRRQADGQLGIGDHDGGQHLRVEDDHLGRGILVEEDRGAADLGAGAGGGRHRDDRRDGARVGEGPVVADVLEIPDRPPLAGHQGDALSGIQAAAAAEGDHPVVAALAEHLDAVGDVLAHRVRLDIAEHLHLEPRLPAGGDGVGDHRQRRHPGIGHQQRPPHAGTTARLGQLADPPRPEPDLGGEAPIGGQCPCVHGHAPNGRYEQIFDGYS